MSYLDDPRVFFAAERTLLAWQRSAIALMGFGFVVERFGLFLRMVQGAPLAGQQRAFSLWLGVALLVVGAFVAGASAVQFRRFLTTLGPAETPKGYSTQVGVWVNVALMAAGLALAAHFVAAA